MNKAQKTLNGIEAGLSFGKAMLKANYSPNYAKNPQKLRNTEQWQRLLAEKLPDDDLLIAHRNALSATKFNDFSGEREPDHAIRLRAAVEGYKLKGKMVENVGNTNTQINITLDGTGYIPPDNVLNIKPTKLKYYKKAK